MAAAPGSTTTARRDAARRIGRAGALLAPAAFLGLVFAIPLAQTARHALDPAAWEWVAGPYVRATLAVALEQAAWSTGLALALAVPLAWLHHTYRLPGSRVQLALHALPFAMPVFVVVYGLQGTLGQVHVGAGEGATSSLLRVAGPMGAVVLAHAYYNYGLAARLIHAALERRPRLMEDAARTLGATTRQAFWRTTAVALAPAVASAALLVFLFSFASFGTVLLLGDGQVRTLETVLYDYLGIVPDLGRAAALGLLQIGLNALLLSTVILLRRRHGRLAPTQQPARPAAWWVQALAWATVAAALAPVAAVLVGGFRLDGAWSLEPWRHLLQDHPRGFDLAAAVGRSLGLAAAATALAIGLTACLAYAHPRSRRAAEALASMPLAQSSLLLALGMSLAYGARSVLPLAGTSWILVLAHTAIAFPFVARALLPALEAHDERLDEAAAVLGAPPSHVLRRVHVPSLRPAIAVAAATATTLSLGDFGATTVLARTSTRPLVAWIAPLDGAFDPLLHARAVAAAGLLAALVLACALAVEWVARREAS